MTTEKVRWKKIRFKSGGCFQCRKCVRSAYVRYEGSTPYMGTIYCWNHARAIGYRPRRRTQEGKATE